MANLDNPHGLNAVLTLKGGRPSMRKYTVATTTAVYQGDVVCLRAAGKVATLKTTGGADNIVGVAANYSAASGEVWVYDDPETIFECQADAATDPGATTYQKYVGATAPLVVTAGNTTTKVSKHELGTGTNWAAVTTGTADPLQIVGYYQGVDNDPSLAHARFLVLLREHIWMGKQIGNVI